MEQLLSKSAPVALSYLPLAPKRAGRPPIFFSFFYSSMIIGSMCAISDFLLLNEKTVEWCERTLMCTPLATTVVCPQRGCFQQQVTSSPKIGRVFILSMLIPSSSWKRTWSKKTRVSNYRYHLLLNTCTDTKQKKNKIWKRNHQNLPLLFLQNESSKLSYVYSRVCHNAYSKLTVKLALYLQSNMKAQNFAKSFENT